MSASSLSLQRTQQHEVQLAVYDLSQGMARVLSAQFLGGPEHAIDIVPHTGIIVYGMEYFFGGGGGSGISAESPSVFRSVRGISPVRTLTLGTTTVSQQEFEDWCVRQMIDGERKYASSAYNLFHNNCNNFSNDAALRGLRLSKGVPADLLEVPHKVLRSPMGQMMQPMLQGMQVSGGNSGLMIPVPTGQGGVGGLAENHNPWANSNSNATAHNSKEEAKEKVKKLPPPPTPRLDANNRPLLSNDTKSANMCVNKFNDNAIKEAAQLLADGKPVPASLLERTYDGLLVALRNDRQVTFALLLLRLLVLQHHRSNVSTRGCLEWIEAKIIDRSDESKLATKMARSMAWCCLSNATTPAASCSRNEGVSLTDSLLETALVDMLGSSDEGSSTEVKQASSGFLYNHVLLMEQNNGDELSDTAVSLLCSCLDGIDEATLDATTRHRRLLIVGRLLVRLGSPAARLVADLGFGQVLKDDQQRMDKDGDLVKEIVALVDYHSG